MHHWTVLLALCAAPSLGAQSYYVTHNYNVGGEGGGDYLRTDAPRHRLFVARQNRIMVVDMNDGHVIAEITGLKGAHGTALVPEIGRGFATSGNDSSILMFDATTYRGLLKIHADEDADAIIYDPASKRVFSFNGGANSSTAVDPRRGTVLANIPLGGTPEEAVSAGDGKLYVNIVDSSQVVEIDARALAVTRRWSTAPCVTPVSIAIDTRHKRLFSGCRSGVMAISDYSKGAVVATVPIGRGVDGAGWDPGRRDAYASNGDGTLTVVHQDTPDKYHVGESVQTGERARTMAIDPATSRIYIATAKFGPVPAESTATNPRRRAPMLPGTFSIVVVEPVGSH